MIAIKNTHLTSIFLAVLSIVIMSVSYSSTDIRAQTPTDIQIVSVLLDDAIQALRENNNTNAQLRLDLAGQELAQIGNYSLIPTVKTLVEESMNALQNNDSQKTSVLLDVVKDQLGTLTNQSSLPDDTSTSDISTFESVDFRFELKYPNNWDLGEGNSSSDSATFFISPVAEETGSGYLPNSHIFIRVGGGWENTDVKEVPFKTINDKRSYLSGFKLLNSSTTETLSGYPAYTLMYNDDEINEDGSIYVATIKEIGTIVNDHLYEIRYSSDTPDFNTYLPSVESIIRSFKISP